MFSVSKAIVSCILFVGFVGVIGGRGNLVPVTPSLLKEEISSLFKEFFFSSSAFDLQTGFR